MTRGRAVPVFDRDLSALPDVQGTLLPYGNGRSYGDVALNDGESLLLTKGLDRFIAFDPVSGTLSCEAGVLIGEILQLIVPRGWFVPVTPGTRFVTVGGAIANDVHGKNHHRRGSFGNHVTRLRLLRSDRGPVDCSPESNPELFSATIGGLGLTGLMLSAEFQLIPVAGSYLRMETRRFSNLAEFFEISAESEQQWEYTVAWVDCIAKGKHAGRGVFYRAEHCDYAPSRTFVYRTRPQIPFAPPFSFVNHFTSSVFNQIYYRASPSRARVTYQHYLPFFYPLDNLPGWNSLYGPRGFLQHQCVVPLDRTDALREIFDEVGRDGHGSFLAVLKVFGDIESLGLLSFPRPGVTLAIDLPIVGKRTFQFLDRLDRIVFEAGGAVYPAKDARMSPSTFERGFPRAAEFERYRDPRFDSSFWRRVRSGLAA
jgi:FAD/FMN-containing dehydrogenase